MVVKWLNQNLKEKVTNKGYFFFNRRDLQKIEKQLEDKAI